VLADELEKKHHVSPLTGMDQTYTFRAGSPGQVVAKIYAQAARLKLKGARYYPHPEGAEVAR
jgi:DUF1365 family protein